MTKCLIEQSPTPIYQRIIESLAKSLRNFGHEVILVNPLSFSSVGEYVRYLNEHYLDILRLVPQI